MVALSAWFIMTATPLKQEALHQGNLLAERLRALMKTSYTQGGKEGVETLLKNQLLPAKTSLVLTWRGEKPLHLAGTSRPEITPNDLSAAYKGKNIVRFIKAPAPIRRIELRVPVVNATEKPVGLVALDIFTALPSGLRTYLGRSLLKGVLTAALVSFLVGLVLSNLIYGPIKNMVSGTQALTRGELQYRLPVPKTDTELAQMSRSFNEMADKLEDTLQRLRAETERALQSEQARREFLAQVSHNLRTPLTAIIGWTEALQDGIVSGEEEDYLQKIHREARFISRKVTRLLDLSRWEQTDPTKIEEVFTLSDPLMEAVGTLSELAQEQNISLTLEGLNSDLKIKGDKHLVRDIFQIFLENIIEHAGSGTHATVKATPRKDSVQIEITDNGKGIDSKECFSPSSSSKAQRYTGSMGLAIARKLITAHNGSLTIEPNQPQGTKVTFTLPTI